MKIRIDGLPEYALTELRAEFVGIEGEATEAVAVYRYIVSSKPARIDGIPSGVRLINEDLHRLQYTHTMKDGTDIYIYVESVHSTVGRVDHDEFVNSIVEGAPEAYDGDTGIESIAIQYVRDLEWARDSAIKKFAEIEKAAEGIQTVIHNFAAEAREQIQERTKTWPGM